MKHISKIYQNRKECADINHHVNATQVFHFLAVL